MRIISVTHAGRNDMRTDWMLQKIKARNKIYVAQWKSTKAKNLLWWFIRSVRIGIVMSYILRRTRFWEKTKLRDVCTRFDKIKRGP